MAPSVTVTVSRLLCHRPGTVFVDFAYDRQVTGNLERAYQTFELWLRTYFSRGGGTE
jgi:hypothetical protein